MKSKERKLIAPLDIVVMVVILLMACPFILRGFNNPGKTAVITVDGIEVRRINLDTAPDETFTLDTDPKVTLKVADGTLSFIDSRCPAKTCQHRGKLQTSGDIAACVPAGVVVSITDEAVKADIDAVVG